MSTINQFLVYKNDPLYERFNAAYMKVKNTNPGATFEAELPVSLELNNEEAKKMFGFNNVSGRYYVRLYGSGGLVVKPVLNV